MSTKTSSFFKNKTKTGTQKKIISPSKSKSSHKNWSKLLKDPKHKEALKKVWKSSNPSKTLSNTIKKITHKK